MSGGPRIVEGQEKGEELVEIGGVLVSNIQRPTPHGDKLYELLNNPKLPTSDRDGVRVAISAYQSWIGGMAKLNTVGERRVADLVKALNSYKEAVELNLIWDSSENFLYRQKGQLKLDNSILEEWFPWLVDPRIMPELADVELMAGPAKAFAAVNFRSTLIDRSNRPGLIVRSKDQDFTIGRRAFVRASFDDGFRSEYTDTRQTYIAYVAAELKTNLDKTMFQEATATSHDLRIAAPGSHYFLICEYLDMTPISSAGTDIDEVLVLRGRRIGSQNRKNYSNAEYRRTHRDEYLELLRATPIRLEVVSRFVSHVRAILQNQGADLSDAVERGYF